jgi:hypothetical protein
VISVPGGGSRVDLSGALSSAARRVNERIVTMRAAASPNPASDHGSQVPRCRRLAVFDAVQSRIARAIHLAHAAGTDRCRDFEMTHPAAWGERHLVAGTPKY